MLTDWLGKAVPRVWLGKAVLGVWPGKAVGYFKENAASRNNNYHQHNLGKSILKIL